MTVQCRDCEPVTAAATDRRHVATLCHTTDTARYRQRTWAVTKRRFVRHLRRAAFVNRRQYNVDMNKHEYTYTRPTLAVQRIVDLNIGPQVQLLKGLNFNNFLATWQNACAMVLKFDSYTM